MSISVCFVTAASASPYTCNVWLMGVDAQSVNAWIRPRWTTRQ